MKVLNSLFSSVPGIILAGAVIGILAVFLQYSGNPPNMGICVACFTRDIAGAIGLHRVAAVQYLRPEIAGLFLGSMLAALAAREWKPRGGSAPLVRFVLGMLAMIGALVFLGCPWRAMLRLAGGDLNAIIGIVGLAAGVVIGSMYLKNGFHLGRSYAMPRAAGLILPGAMLMLLGLLFMKTSFGEGQAIFTTAEGKGPGGLRALPLMSLGIAMAIGALAQRTRFCTVGAIRDAVLIRNFRLAIGVIALILAAFAVNLYLGTVNAGWAGQPIAHSNATWNFLGMALAGMAFVMAGGCPGRQLFLAGEGDADAAIFWFGMLAGAAISHNWMLASVPDVVSADAITMGGPGIYGKIAVIAGIVFCAALGSFARIPLYRDAPAATCGSRNAA